MRRIRGTRLATACACTLHFVHAAAAAPALNDPAGILKALEAGNRDAVTAGLDATKSQPDHARTGAGAARQAHRKRPGNCRAVTGRFVRRRRRRVGRLLRHARREPLVRAGRHSALAQRMRWLREHGYSAVRKQLGKENKTAPDPSIEQIDFAAIEALPAPTMRMSPQMATLKVTRMDVGRGWWPIVEIVVNGQTVRALIDSGFNQSLVLTAKTALRLQATPVATDMPNPASSPAGAPRQQPDSAVQLASVAFGPFSAEHFGALVVPELPHANVDALVGLSLLARFQAVVLGDDRIDLYPQTPSPLCADGARITFTANRPGGDLLTFPIAVNGQSRPTAFDTGFGGLVDIYGEPPTLPAKDIGELAPSTVVGFAGKKETQRAELNVAGLNLGKVEIGLYPSRLFEYPT